jgi:tetratricopeptide (TPR) repeat protein
VTGSKGIWVWDAQGHHRGTIEMPNNRRTSLGETKITGHFTLQRPHRCIVCARKREVSCFIAHTNSEATSTGEPLVVRESRLSISLKRHLFLFCCCLLEIVALICIPVSAYATAFVANQSDEAAAHAERGLEFARAGKLEEAEAELRQAAELEPANAEVLSSLGTILAMQKKLGESTEVFKRALQISPNDLTVRRYLAANLWQLHLYSEAKQNLKIILNRQPEDKGAKLLLGMVSENIGDYATAARMLGSVPDEVRKQPESIAALARSYYHLRQTERARTTLAQLSSHPAGPQAVFLGAQIADEMQDYQTAETMLASIRSNFPDESRLEYSLALVEYHAGRFDQSQRALEKLIDSGNKTAAIFNLLGWCYEKQQQPKEAMQALQESIKLAPEEEANYLDLGKILLAQHSLPSALQTARRGTHTFPRSAATFEFQGLVEMEMGQFMDAVRSYGQAVKLDPSHPGGILGLAQAQFAAGMSKDAATNFETGIRQFPKDARFKAQYGAALLKQSETGDVLAETRAEQLLRSALEVDQSLAEAHYQLGNLALKKGRLSESQQHLEQAVKLDAHSGPAHFALSRVYRRLGRKEEAAHEMELYQNLKSAGSPQESRPKANADDRE